MGQKGLWGPRTSRVLPVFPSPAQEHSDFPSLVLTGAQGEPLRLSPHQLVFDEVTDDFVVEVLDGGPADTLLYVLLLGVAKGAGMIPGSEM